MVNYEWSELSYSLSSKIKDKIAMDLVITELNQSRIKNISAQVIWKQL
jgi:hypothetical protein